MIMDKRLEPLFTPWNIGKCEIKNRIVLTSMGGTDLFGWMEMPRLKKAVDYFSKGSVPFKTAKLSFFSIYK